MTVTIERLPVRIYDLDGLPVRFFQYKGVPCVVPGDAALLLARKSSKTITTHLNQSDEYKEGRHYFILTAEEASQLRKLFELTSYSGDLGAFEDHFNLTSNPIDPKVRRLVIITKAGLWRLAMRARKGIGPQVRDQVEEILTRLERDGFVTLEGALAPPARRDPEGARLAMRGLEILYKAGRLSDPELSLEVLKAMELGTGEVHHLARRSVFQSLKRIADGLGQQSLFGMVHVDDTNEAA